MDKQKKISLVAIGFAFLAALTNIVERLSWVMLFLGIIGTVISIVSMCQTMKIRKKEITVKNHKTLELSIVALILNIIIILIFLSFIAYIAVKYTI